VIGEAEQRQHEAGEGVARHRDLGVRPPRLERGVDVLDQGDLTWPAALEVADGRERLDAVGQDDGHDAGAVGEGGQRLSRAEDRHEVRRRLALRRASCRDDPAGLVGDIEPAAIFEGARRHAGANRGAIGFRVFGPVRLRRDEGGKGAERVEIVGRLTQRLRTVAERLKRDDAAEGEEKGDDERGDCASEERFGRGEAALELGDPIALAGFGLPLTQISPRHGGARHRSFPSTK